MSFYFDRKYKYKRGIYKYLEIENIKSSRFIGFKLTYTIYIYRLG